jgi:hypothetical protein
MPVAIHRRAMKVVCLLAALACADPACADNNDVPPKQQFVIRLKEAVRSGDKIWLADHALYPLRYIGRTTKQIPDRASFLKNYPALIGEKLRAQILAQDPAQVFENYQGMMIGDGPINIWVRERSDDGPGSTFDIITINDKE